MSLLGPNLEAFLTIVKEKTIRAASSELGITQTGVTQRIRSLESKLETTLFTRSRRGMALTQEGEALLRYCQTARDLEGETLAKIKGAGIRAQIRVSILGPTSIMRTRVIPPCLPLVAYFPELTFSFMISDDESGSAALRSGNSQFAVISPEEVAKEMDSKLLKPEQYVLVGPKAWKTRELKDVISRERIIDFDSSDQTTRQYLKQFKLLQFARPDRHFVNNNEALLSMFQCGLGYGVLTKEFAESSLKQKNLAILNQGVMENRLALAWYPRPNMPPYFKKIVRSIT